MEHKAPSINPVVLVVDTSEDTRERMWGIVRMALRVDPLQFDNTLSALEWCTEHPAQADVVIVGEMQNCCFKLSGHNFLKKLDDITPRPVHAIFVFEGRPSFPDAERWFYTLDKVFKMIKPLYAATPSSSTHKIAKALNEAVPWHYTSPENREQTK